MKKFKCNIHDIVVQIPTSDDEFLCGKFHQDIEKCCDHHEEFRECVFEEVDES